MQITERVFHWAARTPHRPAMIFEDQPMTYAQLADAVLHAGAWLAHQGLVGPGVALLATPGLRDAWVLGLALRRLGLTVLPAQSLEMLTPSAAPDPRWVVANPDHGWPGLEDVCAARGFTLVWARPGAQARAGLDWTPAPVPGGQILLSSGTTGAAKMVLMEPSFEPEFIRRRLEVSGLTGEAILNLFNFGAWTGGGYKSVVAAWTVGACVLFDQRPGAHQPLLHPGVTHAMITPGMIGPILAAPPGTLASRERIRLSVTGGALSQRQIDLLRTHVTSNLYNGLGATETNTFGFTPIASPEDLRWHRVVPGRGVEIVDDEDRPTPPGQVGQLRVSAKHGPDRYLHDEAATRAFFRHGYFYPGDLAAFRADGRLALHGRVTDIINVAGHKVSPAPYEERLRDALGVDGVCLFTLQDDSGDEAIHVILEARTQLPLDHLAGVLRRELRGFPRAQVHYLPALPRNAMGKVLRQAARAQVAPP